MKYSILAYLALPVKCGVASHAFPLVRYLPSSKDGRLPPNRAANWSTKRFQDLTWAWQVGIYDPQLLLQKRWKGKQNLESKTPPLPPIMNAVEKLHKLRQCSIENSLTIPTADHISPASDLRRIPVSSLSCLPAVNRR